MKKKNPTIETAFLYYVAAMKLSRSSLKSYAAVKAQLTASLLLHHPLATFTPATLRIFLSGLNLKETTVYLYYIKIKAVINRYITDHNLDIELNLEGMLKPPKYRENLEGEEQYLTLAELTELVAVDLTNEPRVAYAREIFLLMCYSGMAIGDVVGFTPENAISKDEAWFMYRRRKNGNVCTVPLLPMLVNLLKRNTWPVRVKERMLMYELVPLSKLVGRKIGSHSGRHTFGSIMLELGFSMASVSKMMGHGSIQTTEKYYAKVTKDKISRELAEMPDRIKALMI